MPGTIALVGSGEYLPPMETVDRFLLKRLPAPARVVCLPTAAGTEGNARIDYWCNLGVQHFTRLGASAEAVRVVDRAGASDPATAARIGAANFVYLSGGKPPYLMDCLRDTPAWEAILHVLASGGVLAGCSAGAMICGERFPGLRMLSVWHTGFNLVPGAVILPHYDEMPQAFAGGVHGALMGSGTLVGVEGDTAAVYDGTCLTVAGRMGVTVWGRNGKQRYTAGQTLDWPPVP